MSDIPGNQQSLNDLAIFEVRLDNIVNILLVDKGVPDCLGVDHCHRPCGAPVQTASLVDPDLAGARQTCRLDLGLAAVKPCLRAVV